MKLGNQSGIRTKMLKAIHFFFYQNSKMVSWVKVAERDMLHIFKSKINLTLAPCLQLKGGSNEKGSSFGMLIDVYLSQAGIY